MLRRSLPTETLAVTQRRGRRRLGNAIAWVLLLCTAAALIWDLHDTHFPSAAEITSQRVIVLQTEDGRDLLTKGSFRLAPIAAKDMPVDVINAIVSIEDRHFYRHGGIDVPSMLRALSGNIKAGHIVAGGSTITQQLVKILFLGPRRTYARKIQEAVLARWLEYHLTKDEILTSYLNNVYLGSGAIGFPAAAKLYFGKKVADLNLAEAAMLAGMINSPTAADPFHNLAAARYRAGIVLNAMVANEKLSQDETLAAKLNPATVNPVETVPPSTGWFADWIYAQVAQAVPAQGGTVRVRTTLDVHLQELAQNSVQSTLATYGAEKNASQAALVAMRPDGAIVAMVGGGSYAGSQFNRAVQARRQPGSAFKLFDYYAALRQGFSPNNEIFDAPIQVGHWQPENYSRHYHQEVTLAQAFADSLNAATVRLAQQVGIDQVIAAARDLGLRGSLRNTPSVALGTSEVSLLDLTAAYAAVRAGAAPVQPWGIASVRTDKGDKDLLIGRPDVVQHSLAPYQDQLISLLQGVVQHGTGRAAALQGFAAGKTGTTQDYRDAWFIGFNDSLVVGVWVGNDDHSPMNGVVGGTIPAMIWKRFMEQASPPTKTIKAESGDAETALRSSRGAGSRRGSPAASRSWSRAMPRLASTVPRKERRGW